METTFTTVKATPKQLALLSSLGWLGNPAALTAKQASETIDRLMLQRKAEIDALIEDAKRKSETINLIDIAGRFTELRRESAKEYSGPCPKCSGNDRFHVTAEWFFCRTCHEQRGDAIEFVAWREGCTFLEACSRITGGNLPMNTGERVKPISKPSESAYEWDEPRRKHLSAVSHANLVAAATATAWQCMEYLRGRGIELGTIKAFGVGYTLFQLPNTWDGEKFVHPKQLAISLPWFNHDGALAAMKYRFIESHTYTDIDGEEHTENKTSRGQVTGNAFGWQAIRGATQCNVLIVCEGEMNALSLWQAGRGAVDVLSTGSEATTKKLPPVVVELAKGYQHKIVWADKKEIADNAASQIGAASMGSPSGMDANDLLRAGKLRTLLAAMLGRLGVTLPDCTPPCTPPLHTDVQETPVASMATEAPYDAHSDDLTSFVGLDVSDSAMAVLTGRAMAYGWQLEARRVPAGWHVYRLTAKP